MSDDRHDEALTDEEGVPASTAPIREEAPPAATSTGLAWGVILLFFGIALLVVFSVQNTHLVPVRFLWMEGRFALAVVILVTVGVVILLTESIGLAYRRRRRRRAAEREELRKYRGG